MTGQFYMRSDCSCTPNNATCFDTSNSTVSYIHVHVHCLHSYVLWHRVPQSMEKEIAKRMKENPITSLDGTYMYMYIRTKNTCTPTKNLRNQKYLLVYMYTPTKNLHNSYNGVHNSLIVQCTCTQNVVLWVQVPSKIIYVHVHVDHHFSLKTLTVELGSCVVLLCCCFVSKIHVNVNVPYIY